MSKNDGRFKEGNQAALKHGGAGAVKALQLGLPFKGLAEQVEQVVYDELETQGRIAMVRKNAVRLQTASELYWAAVSKAAAEGDLKQLHGYVKQFGWLTSAALRAWAQLRTEELEGNAGAMLIDALTAAKEVDDEGG
jgi:hypothetical protein